MAKEQAVPASPGTQREAVGTFRSEEQLEAAISELTSSGWDRADLSLLGSSSVIDPHVTVPPGQDSREAGEDPDAPRSPVVSDVDERQGRTLIGGMAGVIAAFGAAGAVVVTGGGALAAMVGAAIAGGGATAAVEAAGRWLGARRNEFLQEQIDRGGILLWVALRKPGQEQKAQEILRRHGADSVHIHEVPVEEAHASPPVDL